MTRLIWLVLVLVVLLTACQPTPSPTPTAPPTETALAATATSPPIPVVDENPVHFRGDTARSGQFEGPALRDAPDILWRFQTDGNVRGSPIVSGNLLFVGSADQYVYA
ncbi:MAG: PQQ-binding-like beta-propeller repeat protein [Chloroflexi bacterium]|nr:PQQ-binding-like beta-propeller repeat protein [Chloroflexota bacterium]